MAFLFHSKSGLYGTFVWARRALNGPKRRLPARAVFWSTYIADINASLDEGFLSLSLSNLLYMDNPYSYKKCQ